MILFFFGGRREGVRSCATVLGGGGRCCTARVPRGKVQGYLQRYSNYSWGVRGRLEDGVGSTSSCGSGNRKGREGLTRAGGRCPAAGEGGRALGRRQEGGAEEEEGARARAHTPVLDSGASRAAPHSSSASRGGRRAGRQAGAGRRGEEEEAARKAGSARARSPSRGQATLTPCFCRSLTAPFAFPPPPPSPAGSARRRRRRRRRRQVVAARRRRVTRRSVRDSGRRQRALRATHHPPPPSTRLPWLAPSALESLGFGCRGGRRARSLRPHWRVRALSPPFARQQRPRPRGASE